MPLARGKLDVLQNFLSEAFAQVSVCFPKAHSAKCHPDRAPLLRYQACYQQGLINEVLLKVLYFLEPMVFVHVLHCKMPDTEIGRKILYKLKFH
jgi:hypothetical protein